MEENYQEKIDEMKKSLDRNSEIITDLMIRITAMEQALIRNNIVTEEKLAVEIKTVMEKITQMLPAMAEQFRKQEMENKVEE